MKFLKSMLAIASLCVVFSTNAFATTWNWSFGGESGTFVTDGSSSAAGNYVLKDFTVTSTTTGGTLGSLLGGQYNTDMYSTYQPFSFDWNGSVVTTWHQSGYNTFDWWAFGQEGSPMSYFFGWDTGNINDPTKAAHYGGSNIYDVAYTVTVTAENGSAPVPEPSTLLLLGGGLLGLGFARKRFAKK